jgi:hypothetical protein
MVFSGRAAEAPRWAITKGCDTYRKVPVAHPLTRE